MHRKTLLSQLAARFAAKDEIVATDALTAVLRDAEPARAAFGRLLSALVPGSGVEITRVEHQHQAHERGSPDLALFGPQGRLKALVEAKFWAGLTPCQPSGYLKHLDESGGRVLVFVAPLERVSSLFVTLATRAENDGIRISDRTLSLDLCFAKTPSGAVLSVLSWRRLLSALHDGCALHGAEQTLSDVEQLSGLVERYEAEGFGPLTPEELTDLTVPRRVRALSRMVLDVLERGERDGLIKPSGKGNPYSHWLTFAGRSVELAHATAWFGIHHDAWARYQSSPLWLRFWGATAAVAREALAEWETAETRRLFFDERDQSAFVPVFLLPLAEADEVVTDALRQLREVDDALAAKHFHIPS